MTQVWKNHKLPKGIELMLQLSVQDRTGTSYVVSRFKDDDLVYSGEFRTQGEALEIYAIQLSIYGDFTKNACGNT